MSDKRLIKIFDTTLRDGEQSPGASMNLEEKLEFAHALAELGVDIIEAGFPIASPGDFESVREIANQVRGPEICGLARCNDADIDRAWDALRSASNPRIHVFLATSAIHREFKLKMTPDQIIERAIAGVRRARGYCPNIEFSPEDAARTEIDFLCQVVEAVIREGATTVNIPDTVGYATPTHMGNVIRQLVNRVPNIDKAVIAIHCHNDLGLAVANSLAAVENGAGQIECTINGIGERAGNCALEEVVMAMRVRSDYYHCDTRINSQLLVPTSRLLCKLTGLQVQRNKAIVGRNAFAHESGIHQDGMLKEPRTYEIMRPEDVGLQKTDLVLGKHSGRAALADRIRSLGYELNAEEVLAIFNEFKLLADRKKEVSDSDIVGLIEQQLPETGEEEWSLVDYTANLRCGNRPHVTVTLQRGGLRETADSVIGDGPVDAAFGAIEKITGVTLNCKEFSIKATTIGINASAEASIEVEHQGHEYRGQAVAMDSLEATIKAILNATNRAVAGNKREAVKR
ncbi:MAG: 2-isopropylmalate synthase [Planctomycetota bacterium]